MLLMLGNKVTKILYQHWGGGAIENMAGEGSLLPATPVKTESTC